MSNHASSITAFGDLVQFCQALSRPRQSGAFQRKQNPLKSQFVEKSPPDSGRQSTKQFYLVKKAAFELSTRFVTKASTTLMLLRAFSD